jgi:hypothetical protein
MIIELPIIYLKNFNEVESAEKSGVSIQREETISKTTFIIPKDQFIRINPSTIQTRTTIHFNDVEEYLIDADYETVLEVFKREALK